MRGAVARCPKNCPNRCAVPNCHNEETCPVWAEYMRSKREMEELKAKSDGPQRDLDGMQRSFSNRYFREARRHR